MAWEIHASRTADAGPAAVWTALTGVDSYEEWNPVHRRVRGDVELGATVALWLAPTRRIRVPGRARVTVVDPDAELRWQVRPGGLGLFEGEEAFVLEDHDDGTTVTHSLTFDGAVLERFLGRCGAGVRRRVERTTEALCERAEHLEGV